MRTQGFRTHVLLAVAGAVTVLASLRQAWYARAPRPVRAQDLTIGDVNGPLNGFFAGLQRWVTDPAGRSGWHALGTTGQAIAACAAFSAIAAVGCLTPGVQRLLDELLRYASLAALALVAWRLCDPPGPNAAWELRHGALIALGGALMLAVCGQGVANAPSRRRVQAPRYVPPPPPAYEAT